MKLTRQPQAGFCVVKIEGEIDNYGLPELQHSMEQLMAEGKRKILLDISRVNYIDENVLPVFEHFHHLLDKVRGSFALIGANAFIREFLRSRLTFPLQFFSHVSEAEKKQIPTKNL